MTLYQLGNGKTFYSLTFGCQMNEHDSEVLAGMLNQMGFEKAESENEADLLLINTCAVREKAEQKVLGKIGELKKLKEKNPDMVIAVGGCMVQQEHVANKIHRDFKHVDILFGTNNINRFPSLLEDVITKGKRIKEITQDDSTVFEELPHNRENSIKAWVVISYGCDNYCKYCIVPYVRGQQRSRKIEHIKKEVVQLSKKGYREITLLGQNVNSYGKDLGNENGFEQLLEELEDINGIERIRFMTSHPRDFTEELIYKIRDSEKVCEHIHLPVQAGSNRVLKMMGRGYTRERYLYLVDKIREELPNASITTDLIVGFPGETDEEFQETIDLVKKAQFDSAFTFVYSKRSGTPAAEMEEQVPEKIKKQRIQELIDLQKSISANINQKLEGTVQTVLVEDVSKNDANILTGRTRTDKLVHFPGNKSLVGEFVDVKINHAHSWTIYGELTNF
ncbi:tRNA (N6-isopentenyl adenosine(37)-C2)-methylthiotransferase MiaB [Natranaerobius trueperi]|uniref:tRNA-2-methylthio-N(6)-dimethylallyladenosine synthase n=1 Tax=Natranaerobius trueperi TaxID=759412 RepID=A0A226BVS5_9FIRM|nr:tRNA (N6-isopentenyl adenosine(37)-C2)-methylthiotransferase MiaB [Natranaerobius trueperi]OWZ83093.1 tRNA (N6-isopentenyl adenosine(37)-C2)-methylthiotransferase MiaB [Natranaerobius trueperi]